MSDPIWMTITIGGSLPAKKVEDLFVHIDDDMSEVTGPEEKDLIKNFSGKALWQGSANYGECDDLKAFCERNNLSYVHFSEATGEYDAGYKYWIPGMKGEEYLQASAGGDATISIDTVKPYTDLLLALARDGVKALPLFINNEDLSGIVETGLKSPARMYKKLEKVLNKMLPGAPNIPPLTIT